jgi:hypothetical protein
MWNKRGELRQFNKRYVSKTFVVKVCLTCFFHACIPKIYSRWNDKTYNTDEAAIAEQLGIHFLPFLKFNASFRMHIDLGVKCLHFKSFS